MHIYIYIYTVRRENQACIFSKFKKKSKLYYTTPNLRNKNNYINT